MKLFDDDEPHSDTEHHAGLFRGRWTLEQLVPLLGLHQNTAAMYGKAIAVPRLEAWFGTRPYAFGGRVEKPTAAWPNELAAVKFAVEETFRITLDSCFANLYRDGDDTIAWHSDDDVWIGEPIASVTFGATRRFCMRHKETRVVETYYLGDGDVFVMREGTQAAWEHSIPRSSRRVGPRLNLTFRRTVE